MPGMQGIQLVLLITGVMVPLALLATRFADHPMLRRVGGDKATGIGLGMVAGVIGVIIVAVMSADSVPDDSEDLLRLVAIVWITLALVLGSIYRSNRR
jgi:hypothetical protein